MTAPHVKQWESPTARRRDLAAVDPTEFTAAFRNHAAGVAIVAADVGKGPVGLTATSVFSVSAAPPTPHVLPSDRSSSTPTIRQAETVVVHLLGADRPPAAQLFVTSGVDRFADRETWSCLVTGERYLVDSRSGCGAR